MAVQIKGELVPIGGGDMIPLAREVMTVGRRSTCDICLNFSNVSGQHCEFSYKNGFWYVRDLGSQNGTKVAGERVMKRLLRPGDQIGIATHKFTIQYDLTHESRAALEDLMAEEENVFSQSLMEKAGLEKPKARDKD
jgi:pSer/pThr/pTyr-binding forkhead associated (FHA) protein